MINLKKLLSVAMAFAMVATVAPVKAAETVTGWTGFDGGTVTEANGKVTIDGEGVSKPENLKVTEEGTSVAAHVELKGYEHGELFQLSAAVNGLDGNYETEFSVMTQKNGSEYVVSYGNDAIELEEGIYTYIWTFEKTANGVDVVFTVEDYGVEVGTITAELLCEEVDTVRYLWAFGRDIGNDYVLDRALVIYNELPPKEFASAGESAIDTAMNNKGNVTDLLDLLGDYESIPSDELVTEDQTFEEILLENQGMLENALKYASIVGYDEDQVAALTYLVGTKIGTVKNAAAFAKELVSADVIADLTAAHRASKLTAAHVATYDTVSALLTFKGNVVSAKEDKVAAIEEMMADLESDVLDYKEDNVVVDAKAFAAELAKQSVAGTTVTALVDGDESISYTKLSTIEAFIKKVTKNSYTLDGVRYGDVKDEAVVADYIEGLEEIVEEMEEVKDLLDDTKAEKKAFNKVAAKLEDLVEAIEALDSDDEATLDAYDDAVAAFRATDLEAVKEYVDNVVNEFWTVATEQRASGRYRVKNVDAGLGRYLGFEEVAGADLMYLMTTLVDSEEEDTYYDLLVGATATVDELLEAVTTDIENIGLDSKLTNKEVVKIIAAKKALAQLDADNKAIYNTLSRKERAAVDANRELIDILYVKMLLNSEVVADGWVDLGNGNWDYYKNGEAFTGWVAAGTNWYYVSNGHMLRNTWIAKDATGAVWYYVGNDGAMVSNTTVGGFYINANGEWLA